MDVSSLARLSSPSQVSGISGGGLIGPPEVQSAAPGGRAQTGDVVQLSPVGRVIGALAALQTAAAGLATDGGTDPGVTLGKVTGFVNAFNALQTQLDAAAGDSFIGALQGRLPSLIPATPSGGLTLGQIGITVNGGNSLNLDPSTLAAAVQSNPTAVAQAFSANGIVAQLASLDQLVAELASATASGGAHPTPNSQVSPSGQPIGLFGLEAQMLTNRLAATTAFFGSMQNTDRFLAAQLGIFGSITGGGDQDQDDGGLWGGLLGDISTQNSTIAMFSTKKSTMPQE